MRKPSSIALLLAEGRSTTLRSRHPARPIAARSWFFSQPQAGRFLISEQTVACFRPTRQAVTCIQKRNMSTPADHQPSKKALKTPAVPRPSARYATSLESINIDMLTSLQRSAHLPNEPDSAPPSRIESLQFRLCTCLPRRRTLQNPRRRDPRCRPPRETSRWTRISHGSRARDI
jgi:hypothetical protein